MAIRYLEKNTEENCMKFLKLVKFILRKITKHIIFSITVIKCLHFLNSFGRGS